MADVVHHDEAPRATYPGISSKAVGCGTVCAPARGALVTIVLATESRKTSFSSTPAVARTATPRCSPNGTPRGQDIPQWSGDGSANRRFADNTAIKGAAFRRKQRNHLLIFLDRTNARALVW